MVKTSSAAVRMVWWLQSFLYKRSYPDYFAEALSVPIKLFIKAALAEMPRCSIQGGHVCVCVSHVQRQCAGTWEMQIWLVKVNKERNQGECVSVQTQGHWEEESNTPGTSETVISLLSAVMQGIVFSTLLSQLARLEVLLYNSPSFLTFLLKVKPGHFFSVCLCVCVW